MEWVEVTEIVGHDERPGRVEVEKQVHVLIESLLLLEQQSLG